MAEGTIEATLERTLPTRDYARGIVGRKPLPWSAILFAVLVSDHGRSGGSAKGRAGSEGLLRATDHHKLIHKPSVGHYQVDGSACEVFLLGRKLREEVMIAGMQRPKDEHDLQDRRNSNQGLGQGGQMALKARAELVKTLLLTLSGIEESEKGSEGVRDR